MKAYVVGLKSNDDAGNEIIFAENTKEARKKAHSTELSQDAENFLDIKVRRLPEFDHMENATQREMYTKMWREGWWFHQAGAPNIEESNEIFDKWYTKTYESEENR